MIAAALIDYRQKDYGGNVKRAHIVLGTTILALGILSVVPAIRANADGSTDLYLGPKAPVGKQANWLATVPGKGYFAILRLYGPTEAAIDKTWKPGDIEKVK